MQPQQLLKSVLVRLILLQTVFEKKKKAARNKISKINVMVVHSISDGVPKVTNKERLIGEGRLVKVDLTRQMQLGQVKAVFLNAASISRDTRSLML